MKRLSFIISPILVISITALIFLILDKNNPPLAKPIVVVESDPMQRYYEIDKVKLDIEMLEVDKLFNIRPDNVIENELEIANAKLKRLTELFK